MITDKVSSTTASLIVNSVKDSSKKQYNVYLHQFVMFIESKNISLMHCSHNELLSFLEQLYSKGLGYSAMNTARSAVSTVLDLLVDNPVGKHKLVSRFMKGVFAKRPALPRYTSLWDPDIVLAVLDNDTKSLSLLDLSRKSVMLLMLCSAQRLATIAKLKARDLHFTENSLCINITEIVKQTKPGVHQAPLQFSSYTRNENLCVIATLRQYLASTNSMRDGLDDLWLTTTQPHRRALKDTITNWVKHVLQKAGLKEFAPHSVRGAGTSKAAKTLPIDAVLRAGGWSKESTFRKFYNRPLVKQTGIDMHILP